MEQVQDDPTASSPPLPEHDWRPLPPRGAALYACSMAITLGLSLGLPLGIVGSQLLRGPTWVSLLCAVVAALALGAIVGALRHRRMGWKLDGLGFATRRGGLWRTETLVPVSRVQHLDLERGPLERRMGLATLVVHTAGTRMAAVKLPLLALEDAEALRTRLARQADLDDAL